MGIFRFIFLSIFADKLALADTGNTCEKHSAFVLNQSVKLFQFHFTSTEIFAGWFQLTVGKDGIRLCDIFIVKVGVIILPVLIVRTICGNGHSSIEHFHKMLIIGVFTGIIQSKLLFIWLGYKRIIDDKVKE
ncbi:unknown [Ruminococcus sp. CAG:624]|nr:unknown [Ruminococcus sp. CAG:624]